MGSSRSVIEFDATLRIGREVWRGVGVWDCPTSPEGWQSMAENVAYAFTASATPILARGAAVTFSIQGVPFTAQGGRLVSVTREIAKAPDDSPDRVTWRPFLTVQEGGEHNG